MARWWGFTESCRGARLCALLRESLATMQKIRENIRVAVIFGPGSSIKPVWFDWRGVKYTIREITYAWQEREGNALILRFAVTDGADLYELAYNSVSRVWSLAAVETEENRLISL